MIRKRVIVHGRVQGVGFRWFTEATAREIGVSGFVRNRADGTVEVEVEGDPAKVASMVAWLKNGPSYARVTRIEVMDVHPTGDTNFQTKY